MIMNSQRPRRSLRALAGGTVMVLSLTAVIAQADPIAFTGGRVMPVTADPVDNGVLIIDDGEIIAVGSADDVRIPRGAEVIDVSGQVIVPGFVDTHSHIGEPAGGDRSSPIQPEARVLDSLNVRDAGFRRALAGGLTTVHIMSGSGHLMSGQSIYVKLREGNDVTAIAYRKADGSVDGGMKMANGTNPRRDPPFPGTRAKSAALVRQKFIAAQEYMAKVAAAEDDASKMPDRDLGMEALVEVLNGERIVHHHTHRHDDVMTVLRLQEEFGFRVVLHHVSEAHRVANEIAAANVPVSLILIDSPGGKLEAQYTDLKSAPALEQAGAKVSFHTDDYISDSRLYMRQAGLGVRAGMSPEFALRALTLAGAEMLDLDDRIGSLEPGKDADFVILSGDPTSVYTRVQETWVEGQKRFDIDDPDDRAVAEGGFGVLQPSVLTDFHGYGEGH
ncbi:MAG: amidohydrolase family protein [Gammaproteobacteria bacterium]|nr:amidohydrolase family protein [Gammaproteobacteria bacterium]